MTPLWTPSASRAARTHLAAFARAASAAAGRPLDDYWALHAWSIAEPDAFWRTCLRESGLPYARLTQPHEPAHDGAPMPATRWFAGVTVNYAEALLAGRGATGGCRGDRRHQRSGRGSRDLPRRVAPRRRPRGGGAGARRHRRRRHRRRVRRQRAGGGDPAPRLRRARRDLLVLLARLRRRRRLRALPPDRAEAAARLVLVSLQRQALRHRHGRRRSRGAPARIAARRRPGRGHRRPRRRGLGRLAARLVVAARPGAAALRSPARGPLFVRHDRPAQGAGAPRRRRAAEAPHGAAPARRHRPRRSAALLHHLRLDDVELAGLGAGRGRDHRALRRVAVAPDPRRAVGRGRSPRGDALRDQRPLHPRLPRRRPRAVGGPAPRTAAHRVLDGLAARADRLRVGLSRRQGGRPSRQHLGRHRHRRLLHARRADRTRLRRRDPGAGARRRPRGLRRRRPAGRRAGRASWSAGSRCRRCRCASGATPTAHAIAPPTSSASPACGGTATSSRSPRTAASSSTAAATPP